MKIRPGIGVEIEFSSYEEGKFLSRYDRDYEENEIIYEHQSPVFYPFNELRMMHAFLEAFSSYARLLKNEHPKGNADRRAGSMHAHLSLTDYEPKEFENFLKEHYSTIRNVYLYFLPIAARYWSYRKSHFRVAAPRRAKLYLWGTDITEKLIYNSKFLFITYNSGASTLEFRANEFPPFYLPLVPVVIFYSLEKGIPQELQKIEKAYKERKFSYDDISIQAVEKITGTLYTDLPVRAVNWAINNNYIPGYAAILIDIMSQLIEKSKKTRVTMSIFARVTEDIIKELN